MSDRAAALRAAVRATVAEHGLAGASMSLIARAAGVAVGTAYVHYDSKDELVIASYLEVKQRLGVAVSDAVDRELDAETRFRQLWSAAYRWFAADRSAARFLLQLEAGPHAGEAHRRALAVADDPLVAEASRPDVAPLLVDLPLLTLYDLALGPAMRAAAAGHVLDDDAIDALATACWRAVTRPG